MARKIQKGAWVFAEPNTFGPIGPVFAPDTTSQSSLNSGGWLPKIVALANQMRQGLINANLASATGSITAEAQTEDSTFVKPLVATGGTLNAALSAFTSTYVQAEWVACRALVNQIRTTLLNALIGTTTADQTARTRRYASAFLHKDVLIGGTAPAAANAQGATYSKTDVDTIIAVMEYCRLTFVMAGLASDRDAVEVINLVNDGGSTPFYNAVLDLAPGGTVSVDFDVASITDSNGNAKTATLAIRAKDMYKADSPDATKDFGVVAVTRVDNDNYTITAKNRGTALVEVYAPNGAKAQIMVNVIKDEKPASIVLLPVSGTLDISDGDTQQLTWTVLNASGKVLAEYTNDNTYVTFVSAQPASASVSAAGLVTPLGAHAAFNITATFSRTLRANEKGAGPSGETVTFSDTYAVTTQA